MIRKFFLKGLVIKLIILLVLSSFSPVLGYNTTKNNITENTNEEINSQFISEIKNIEIEIEFSNPEIVPYNDYLIIRIKETDLNRIDSGRPVIPVNLSVYQLPFGSEIIDVEYEKSTPIIYDLSKKLAFGSKPGTDNMVNIKQENTIDKSVYENTDPYPSDWVYYHTGGGLSHGIHKTFLTVRVYPVRYHPLDNQLHFIEHITVNISYREPLIPIIEDNDVYDLLILTPSKYSRNLEPLVTHKNNFGVKTKLITLEEVYEEMYWHGRDKQEEIKYFIKEAIENWGITHVLLVGGLKGQTYKWNFPVRYSRVVPPEEQEYAEESFISDLYYADIYDSKGDFSSWDSNNDDIFAVWNASYKEEMDLYPDIYLGRLPCRTNNEVKIMVNKIINYEKEKCDEEWFKNLLIVAGDSYNDPGNFNEGELIGDRAIEIMPDFTPIKVYASEQDINRTTVNNAMEMGSGFAYFCGHGSPASWNTHYPPDGTEWTTGYDFKDIIFLRNKEKLPVTVVGGCHNGQFDVTMRNIQTGFLKDGFDYFSLKSGNIGQFWHFLWLPNCWAWWLTSKSNGGTIATIANTGLGTHGEDDSDNNSIADYLEVLDGWLELRFLQLYGEENFDILGENHGDTMTGYLHRFLGDEAMMDVKMVQQWELFGDPSLKIGGYD
jgi:hypothetical protein